MKLAVNALFGIQVAALGEVLGMTRRSGISDADAIEAGFGGDNIAGVAKVFD